MTVELQGISQRFGNQWLFKNLNYKFSSPGGWAITGPNGSGKTTLLKIIAGMMPSTEGKVLYSYQGCTINPDDIYRHLSFSGPYMELLEEFTLKELLRFHFALKPRREAWSEQEMAEHLGLHQALNRPISKFSSGMKQRIRLGLSTFSDVPMILLDEPASNLDQEGIAWYNHQLRKLLDHKLVIICSNTPTEYEFCQHQLSLKELG